MAAESNTGFHLQNLGSAMNRHAISFQSGAINSTSEMIPMASYFGVTNTAGMIMPGNSNIINNNPVITQAGNSSGSLLLDSVPGLKHDTGLAVEWSLEEQYRLEEGLDKYVLCSRSFKLSFLRKIYLFTLIRYSFSIIIYFFFIIVFVSIVMVGSG